MDADDDDDEERGIDDDDMDADMGGDGGDQSFGKNGEIREQDRFLPIANIARIMKKVLPGNAKIAKDSKESIQECVSEFISFITSEASDKCQQEKRKTINGDDLLWAMSTLGFEKYIDPLKLYLSKYRDSVKGDKPEKKSASSKKNELGLAMKASQGNPSLSVVQGQALSPQLRMNMSRNGPSSNPVIGAPSLPGMGDMGRQYGATAAASGAATAASLLMSGKLEDAPLFLGQNSNLETLLPSIPLLRGDSSDLAFNSALSSTAHGSANTVGNA
jgi:nuclear transcription Y subunit beta